MVNYVFKRYELKYQLSWAQYRTLKEEMEKRLLPDEFGETTIQSLYYDTDDFRIIRASLEKPVYKEKMRLRCYGLGAPEKDLYLEMKRKYEGVVYKRRISCKESDLPEIFKGHVPPSQIGRELAYFQTVYPSLSPKILILCDRIAYHDKDTDLRVTFDRQIRYRNRDFDFSHPTEGSPLLPPNTVLMELKSGTAYPLWLCNLLSELKVQKSSFSKYGAAYEREFSTLLQVQGVSNHV